VTQPLVIHTNMTRIARSHVVRPSVTLVDRSEILETNCTDNELNTFALLSRMDMHLLPGEHGEILGRLEVGREDHLLSLTLVRLCEETSELQKHSLCYVRHITRCSLR